MQHFKDQLQKQFQDELEYKQEIIKRFQITKPYRTDHVFHQFRNYKKWNHVAMDGGKFLIKKDEVIKSLTVLLKEGLTWNSLVPQIQTKSIFFCDIDYLNQDETVEDVLEIMIKYLLTIYDEESVDEIYMLKSKTLHRYHVYFPKIILLKDRLDIFWNDVNSQLMKNGFRGVIEKGQLKPPIDTNIRGGVRYDGFAKYNTRTSRYEYGTEYLPYFTKNTKKFELDYQFYDKTYLLIDDGIQCTGIKKKQQLSYNSNNIKSKTNTSSNTNNIDLPSQDSTCNTNSVSSTFDFSQSSYSYSINNSNSESANADVDMSSASNISFTHSTDSTSLNDSNLDNTDDTRSSVSNKQSTSHVNPDQGSTSEEYFGQHAYDHLMDNHPSLLKILKGHDIKKIGVCQKGTPNETKFIHLGKTAKDRKCPFTKSTHRHNNTYYIWIKKKGTLQHRCYGCKGRYENVYVQDDVLYNEFVSDDDSDDEMLDDDDIWTDVDLAYEYLQVNTNLLYTTEYITKKGEEGTFFHFDEKKGIWVADDHSYILKRDLSRNFKKIIKKQWKQKIRRAKNDTTKKKLINQGAILNRKLGDFKQIRNVLEALKTLCVTNCELDSNPWYFVANNGVMDLRTGEMIIPRKDEYITNARTAKFDIVPFDQEMNDKIHEMLFKKLFPDKSQCETMLYYFSTALNGKTLKKFLINLGKYFSFILFSKYINFIHHNITQVQEEIMENQRHVKY